VKFRKEILVAGGLEDTARYYDVIERVTLTPAQLALAAQIARQHQKQESSVILAMKEAKHHGENMEAETDLDRAILAALAA
jgi:aryl-alcohol dehydrogenase-like predicted oxidoreductase